MQLVILRPIKDLVLSLFILEVFCLRLPLKWVRDTDCDIVVISESCLNHNVADTNIALGGHNIFRQLNIGMGQLFILETLNSSVIISTSVLGQFEL